jgi:hypothetical protein
MNLPFMVTAYVAHRYTLPAIETVRLPAVMDERKNRDGILLILPNGQKLSPGAYAGGMPWVKPSDLRK